MEGDVLASLVKLFFGTDRRHAILLDRLVVDEGIEGEDLHPEAVSHFGDVDADVSIGVDADLLAAKLGSRFAVVVVAGAHDHHAEDELRHGVRVLSGCIHGDDILLSCLCTVDVVKSGSGADDDLQLFGGIQDLRGDFVTADDHCIRVDNCSQQIRLVRIAFEELDIVFCCLEDFGELFDGRW